MRGLKKNLISLLFSFTATLSFAQNTSFYKDAPKDVKERIEKAEKLIAQKKYDSADKALGFDNNEYIIYKRVLLYSWYYSVTDNFKTFGLKDLAKNESLEDTWLNPKGILAKAYDVPKIISDYEAINGEKAVLKLALANYYSSFARNFGTKNAEYFYKDINSKIKETYKRAEELGQTDEYFWYINATYKFAERDFVTAEKYYKNAIELNPNFSFAYHYLAQVQVAQNKLDDAITSLKKAISLEIFKKSLGSHYELLGTLYYKGKKDYKNALKTFKEAEKKIPEFQEFNLHMANIYLAQKDYAKAESELLNTVKKEPNRIDDCIKTISTTSDKNKIVSFLIKASDLHKNDYGFTGYVQYILGISYFQFDDKKEAKQAFANARTNITKAGTIQKYEPNLSKYEAQCE